MMAKRTAFWTALTAVIVGVTVFAFVGCEDEPALTSTDDLLNDTVLPENPSPNSIQPVVDPAAKHVTTNNQRISFRVKGGVEPYRWSVGSDDRGVLTSMGTRGDYAIYTVRAVAPNTVVVIDGLGRSAVAELTTTASDTLQIIPEEITLVNPPVGPVAVLQVVGGVPPYSDWNETFPALGVVGADDAYYVMTAGGEGTNLITVTDSEANVAQCSVVHLIEPSGLTIIPSTTSLTRDGDQAYFIAGGGVPPYDWSRAYPGRGSFVLNADNRSITYTRTSAGDQIIVLEDSYGNSKEVTVTQPAVAPLRIVPDSVTLASNVFQQVFYASNGVPPYVWGIDSGPGTLNTTAGSSTVYDRNGVLSGGATLKLTDNEGSTAFATITLQ